MKIILKVVFIIAIVCVCSVTAVLGTLVVEQQRELEQQRISAEIELEQQRISAEIELEQQRISAEYVREIELEQQRELQLQYDQQQQEKNKIILHAQNMPLVKGWMNGELTFYVEKLPSYVSQNVQNSVESLASQIDGTYINGVKMKQVYSWGDINVNWTKEYKEDAIGQMFGDDLFVGLGMSSCEGDWRPFDGTSVQRIMYHEIGHAMGQAHNSDYNNVMYASTDTRFEIDHKQSITLTGHTTIEKWFCNSGKISFTTEKTNRQNNDASYKVYVLNRAQDMGDIINGFAPFYADCSGYDNSYYAFSRNCNVEYGSSLVISNSYADIIYLDLNIFDENPRKDVDYTFEYDSRYSGLTQDYENHVKQLFR